MHPLPLPPEPSAIRRVAFFGTPEIAVPFLDALVAGDRQVSVVVTRADARRSRRGAPQPSPVKEAAQRHGLDVTHDPDDACGQADVGVVVAYGRLLKPPLLGSMPLVNVHFSLLPRWRGAAPVERAILAGDPETGVCLMEVVPELDEGAVFRQAKLPIGPADTAAEVRARLASAGVALLADALRHGFGPPEPQRGEPVYASKISPDDLRLDFTQPTEILHRIVRVGGAHTMFRGKRLKVHDAAPAPRDDPPGDPGEIRELCVATADGWLRLIEVQPEGKARQPAEAWANGARLEPGDRLGT